MTQYTKRFLNLMPNPEDEAAVHEFLTTFDDSEAKIIEDAADHNEMLFQQGLISEDEWMRQQDALSEQMDVVGWDDEEEGVA